MTSRFDNIVSCIHTQTVCVCCVFCTEPKLVIQMKGIAKLPTQENILGNVFVSKNYHYLFMYLFIY